MLVSYVQRDHIATITLRRPEVLNALSRPLLTDLETCFERFRTDSEAWVGILTGADHNSFSAGADLKERSTMPDDPHVTRFYEPNGSMPSVFQHNIMKPMIAAVAGTCYGGGLELALQCDIRIAAENASFALPEPHWGFFPGGGAPVRLVRLIPFGWALQMLFTGDPINAAKAMAIGLVNDVVPVDQLEQPALG